MTLTLFPIAADGSVAESQTLNSHAEGVLEATLSNYAKTGYAPPWIGYLCFLDGTNVGTCAFTRAPAENHVEIAYYTFPEFEGRGYARQAAEALIAISQAADPAVVVTAHTLPVDGPSTHILTKLGFVNTGSIVHQDDGEIWRWVLSGRVAY